MDNWHSFYVEQSITSNPGEYVYLFGDLPDDIPSLCKIAQNVIIHSEDAVEYGIKLPKERIEMESNLRKVSR